MNNKKKTYRITNKFRFITALTLCMLIFAFTVSGFMGFDNAAGNNVQSFVTIRVQEGDTLWGLAKSYGPKNVDLRRVIAEIQQINNVSASTLQAGMYISIPETL